jgi:hypothetical protein
VVEIVIGAASVVTGGTFGPSMGGVTTGGIDVANFFSARVIRSVIIVLISSRASGSTLSTACTTGVSTLPASAAAGRTKCRTIAPRTRVATNTTSG